jgi:DNA polymerase alpha subunit B
MLYITPHFSGQALCAQYKLSADELADRWEAFQLNATLTNSAFDASALDALSNDIQAKAAKLMMKNEKSVKSVISRKRVEIKPEVDKNTISRVKKDSFSSTFGTSLPTNPKTPSTDAPKKRDLPYSTPSNGTAKAVKRETGATPSSAATSPPSATSYANRQNAGAVIAKFNEHLPIVSEVPLKSTAATGSRCEILQHPFGEDESVGNVRKRYRYMYTSVEERGVALEKHLLEMQAEYLSRYQLKGITPLSAPSQEAVTVCGRVCCEAPSGKMNKTAVMLEGSIKDSGGMRVHLDLSDMEQYALFPGQVVVVEGMNSTGRRLVAKRIYSSLPQAPHVSTPQKLIDFQHGADCQGGAPLTMVMASGPYTLKSDLNYAPLADLLAMVQKTRPDVLLLMGPFVDANHPQVAAGEMTVEYEGEMVECTFEDTFAMKVKSQIEKMLVALESEDHSSPKVVMIPSLQDVHQPFVFPQPPMEYDFDVPQAQDVVFMSNPATFCVNEVTVGVNTSDILFHMGTEEISRVPKVAGQSRLGRLSEHMLHQRSYYPLFPGTNDAPQLDLRHSKKYGMQKTPDVLITPSKLAHFVHNAHVGNASCFCINPGTMVKGNNGGTFARLTVHPTPEKELQRNKSTEGINHNVVPRTKVEIMRI